jgi:hypothetical protein
MSRKSTQDSVMAACFSIAPRFRRSVHVEHDRLSAESLEGYRPTAVALRTLDRIFAGATARGTSRAWSLTGPYGSGKSSFAVFLAALVARGSDNGFAHRVASKLLRDAGIELPRVPQLFPVLITGERQPLGTLLVRGLASTLSASWTGRKPKALAQLIAQGSKGVTSTRAVVEAYSVAIELVRTRGLGSGLLVVLDEAGKALEYAAERVEGADVIVLQELAELAARSGEAPFVFITIFHQSFGGYAARLSPTQRNEWEKVQGRFEDIAFVDSWDQTVRLIADAIDKHPLPKASENRLHSAVARALESVQLPAGLQSEQTAQLLLACEPLHPYVSLLLGPLFRTGVFQNERSLFAFLASAEPGGLQAFLNSTSVGSGELYPLDLLFDYVDKVLQSRAAFTRPHVLRVAEVALPRVPDSAGSLGDRLVKAIALISWLGEKIGLRADHETLGAAVTAPSAEVQNCLAALVDASVITYRSFRSSYVVWEGSDIPIDEVIATATQKVLTNVQAAALLEMVAPLDPVVARRHLFVTGTLRYFPVEFVAAEKLQEFLVDPPANSGDGNVFFVVLQNHEERRTVTELLSDRLRIEAAPSRPILCVLPRNPARLLELLGEFAALEQLVVEEPRLLHDPVAKREISARRLELEAVIVREVERTLGGREVERTLGGQFDTPGEWFWRDQRYEVTSLRQLSALASKVCDEVYNLAPHIKNELVNRNDLSSAAASARKSLLAAMLSNPGLEAFGIEGNPPEKSMYLSIFKAPHNLHGKIKGQWTLKEPPKKSKEGNLASAWHDLRAYFEREPDRRIDLEAVYARLEAPPYGLKRGVLPIVFVHFLAMNAASLAVYENDAFVPTVADAIIERLLKAPRNFQVQWFPMTDARQRVLTVLGTALEVRPNPGGEVPSLLQLVKRLIRMASDLQRYSQLTRRVSSRAVAVREALFQAKEPGPLLFRQLPLALSFEPFRADGPKRNDAGAYAKALASAVEELRAAYGHLLDAIEDEVANAFALPDLRGAALQKELAARAMRVSPHAVTTRLRAALVRMVDDAAPRSEWLVSLGTLFGKKPPEHWLDSDFGVFRTELLAVRREFGELESLTLAEASEVEHGASTRRLFRVAISELGAPSRERVVSLSRKEEQLAEALRHDLERMLVEYRGDLTFDARLATLGAVVASLIDEARRDQANSDIHDEHEHD